MKLTSCRRKCNSKLSCFLVNFPASQTCPGSKYLFVPDPGVGVRVHVRVEALPPFLRTDLR